MSTTAGCNDHLSKPISKQNLLKALEKISAPGTLGEASPAGGPAGQIDIPPGLEAYAKTYIQEQYHSLSTLQTLPAERNFDKLRVHAHNIKGTGTSYGFPEITRIGSLIETAAKERDATTSAHQLACLAESVQHASEYLKSIESR